MTRALSNRSWNNAARSGAFAKTLRTRYVEVGGDFAVGQREPDEPQAHAESGRDVGQIVSLAWNAKMIRSLIRQNGVFAATIISKVCVECEDGDGVFKRHFASSNLTDTDFGLLPKVLTTKLFADRGKFRGRNAPREMAKSGWEENEMKQHDRNNNKKQRRGMKDPGESG